MRVLLVAPSNEDSTYIKPLWAAVLAAHTPPSIEVLFRDDALDPIDVEQERSIPELVAISVNSKTASRAYALADAFRARGATVVLGGIHVTALPQEGLLHADAVVVGEAEGQWPRVVEDARAGLLGPSRKSNEPRIYRHDDYPELVALPKPRRELFRSVKYVPFDVVQTTRGCPYPCEFCSVSTYSGTRFRFRPVREVLAELEETSPRLLFADDNVMIHTRYSRELFGAMTSLKKTWVGQASLATLNDEANVRLLARSGCKALFIGFESVSEGALQHAGKPQNRPHRYGEIVRRLAGQGIAVWGSFVFGLDEDDANCFDRTVDFCVGAKMTLALFALLTPYPGTRLYERLAREQRLTKPTWWQTPHHDRDAPFYTPARMSRDELKAGWVRAWRQLYAYGNIARRYDFALDHSWIQNLAFWPINLVMHEIAERKIGAGDRSWRKHRALDLPFGF